ncbi:hypothetical protein [Anaerococcus marasmi]|uniref:hypothetical protein n=1 Tax=Anaerococcus marasmi TaxID=2057797 RepID=UPI000CF899B9|nr:hypothetical protein [Anaerococcus marasmi]
MENSKSLNLKIKVKGLDDFREKLDELSSEFEKLKNNMDRINVLVNEINELDLVVDVDRDLK